MTVAEDIARMKLATLLEYRTSYEGALSREPNSTLSRIYRETLELINAQIAQKMPIVPVLASEEQPPF